MKALLLMVFLMSTARADHPTFTPPEGFKLHPYQVCRSMRNSDYYSSCIDIITEDDYKAELNALITCDTLFSGKLTVKCLKLINGQRYENSALGLCNTYRSAQTTVKCLKLIGGYRFDIRVLELCHEHEQLGIMDCLKQLRRAKFEKEKEVIVSPTPRCRKYRDTEYCLKED